MDVHKSTVLGALSVEVADELRVDVMKQQLLLTVVVWDRVELEGSDRVREGEGCLLYTSPSPRD